MIGTEARSLSTKDVIMDVTGPGLDVARIAVVERHRGTGRVGLGYVTGFGLERGAIASTVAHDAHNCMVVGARDGSGPKRWRPAWPGWRRSAVARWRCSPAG